MKKVIVGLALTILGLAGQVASGSQVATKPIVSAPLIVKNGTNTALSIKVTGGDDKEVADFGMVARGASKNLQLRQGYYEVRYTYKPESDLSTWGEIIVAELTKPTTITITPDNLTELKAELGDLKIKLTVTNGTDATQAVKVKNLNNSVVEDLETIASGASKSVDLKPGVYAVINSHDEDEDDDEWEENVVRIDRTPSDLLLAPAVVTRNRSSAISATDSSTVSTRNRSEAVTSREDDTKSCDSGDSKKEDSSKSNSSDSFDSDFAD